MRQLGKLRQSKTKLKAALDTANDTDPSYPDALWEAMQIYIRAKKSAPALKILNQLIEAGSSIQTSRM